MSLGYDASLINESTESWTSCVFGYFIDYRMISVGKINHFIRTHWAIRGHILVHKMDDLYVFKCSDERDKNDIIERSIAFFDGALMVFRDWLPNTPPQTMSFRDAKVWVRVYGLPFEFLNNHIAALVGSIFEEKFSVSNFDNCPQNDYLRIRVLVHLDKPLIPGFYLALHDGSLLWVQFKYEDIIKFCVRCGQLGHKINGCCETEEKIRSSIDKLMSEVLARGFPILQAEDNFLMVKLDLRVNSHVPTSNKRRFRMGQDEKINQQPCVDRKIYPGTKFEKGFQPFMGPVLQPKKQGGNACGETVQESAEITHSSSSMEEVMEIDAAKEQSEVKNFSNDFRSAGETISVISVEYLQNVDTDSYIRVTSEFVATSISDGVLNDQMSPSDGFMADFYHESEMGWICKDAIMNARKRKRCTQVNESLVPSEVVNSIEQATIFLTNLAKRRCVGAGIRGRQVNARNCDSYLSVADVVLVESCDSSSVKEQAGFAEVGPSQPPLSLEKARVYLMQLSKRACWGKGIHEAGSEKKKKKKNEAKAGAFHIKIVDSEMVESSDSFSEELEKGFAEVGPSQPPSSP